MRRCPPPALNAALGFHFAMDYILTERKREAYRRDVTQTLNTHAVDQKILKQRGGRAQSSLCTLPGSTRVPETVLFGARAVGKQAQPRLAGVACHQSWPDRPLSGGILSELDEVKSKLDSIVVYWAKFLSKVGWCQSFCGGKGVSTFVPRGLVNPLICTETNYRNKPPLDIATRRWH